MKEYIIDGKHYLYKEGMQPKGAVEFKKAEVRVEVEPKAEPKVETKTTETKNKAVEQPKNKARETKKK